MPATLDFDGRLEETLTRIQESDEILPENKELLNDYRQDRTLNGTKSSTIERDLSALKIHAEHVNQPFTEMTKDDVKDLVTHIHSKYENEYTRSIHKRAIRNLWKWKNNGEHPHETEWIKTNHNGKNNKLPQDLLTKEEIEKQIEACNNPRDKALVAMLYETGARIGELIDLTVGDIEDRQHGRKVVIDGKTGARRLPLVESVPYINKWLNAHPNPEKDAPLWCKIQQGAPEDQLGYRYIREKILKKSMEEAEIDKPSNPHHYRHSRASYLANEMTEAQLCEWFGWVQGSDVPAKYVHLSGRDIDNAYDAMHGLYEPDEDEEKPDVVECPRCSELNEPGAKFCMKCGFALDEEVADLQTEVSQDIGAEKALAELGESADLSPEQIDALADDDALMARLIEARAERA